MDIKVLFGKPKTYTIAGQEFTFKPLEVGDADMIVAMDDKNKRGEAIKNLIRTTFKKSYPELSDEDLDQISLTHMEELLKAIMDVNNLEVPK